MASAMSAAFDLLKWLSQEANVKLRLLAEQICEDFRSAGPGLTSQAEFDHLLLTARERVNAVGAQELVSGQGFIDKSLERITSCWELRSQRST